MSLLIYIHVPCDMYILLIYIHVLMPYCVCIYVSYSLCIYINDDALNIVHVYICLKRGVSLEYSVCIYMSHGTCTYISIMTYWIYCVYVYVLSIAEASLFKRRVALEYSIAARETWLTLLQHGATHCSTLLQHTATHCNTLLQHTATHPTRWSRLLHSCDGAHVVHAHNHLHWCAACSSVLQ